MGFFKLEKPHLPTGETGEIFSKIQSDEQLRDYISASNEPEYFYWDTVKHRKPLPAGLTPAQGWFATKIARIIRAQKTPIRRENGKYFSWVKLAGFERFCHEFDLNTGGELVSFIGDLKKEEQQRLISKGIMDEAIASSQLEGADTGREYARKMLREGMRPRNQSDQMIVNNHKVMMAIESRYKDGALTRDLLIEIHALLTEKTLDDEGRIPQWRPAGEEIFVHDKASGDIYHKAPDTIFIEEEIGRFIDFANDKNNEDFIHPIVKATILHFWLAYLHPFTDGNGRLSRVIFYWYLLKKNYWAFAYLPLSAVIKRAPKQYVMAYVYAEQDDSDLTYFISYIFRKVREASVGFQSYLKDVRKSNLTMVRTARVNLHFNDRQIQIVRYLSGNKENYISVKSHTLTNRISKATAINDLRKLEEQKYLLKKRTGRNTYYFGTQKIESLFRKDEG